jgi:hypothetical protein
MENFGQSILREKWTREQVLLGAKKIQGSYMNSQNGKTYIGVNTTRSVLIFIDWHYSDSLEITFGPDDRVATCKFESIPSVM